MGMEQNKMTDGKLVKERIRNEFRKKINLVCKSGLHGKNLMKAINTFAISVLKYSFGFVKWSETDTEELQRNTRTILTKHRYHHPKVAIKRTMVPRREGGGGIMDISSLRDRQIMNMRKYFLNKKQESKLMKAVAEADDGLTLLNLSTETDGTEERIGS